MSSVACLSAVFRNLEGLVTSHTCSFHPAARLGQTKGASGEERGTQGNAHLISQD